MKVIIIGSLAYSLVNFRGQLIEYMLAAGHDVLACAPDRDDAVIGRLARMGARFHRIPMGRAKLNPLEDALTLLAFIRLFRAERPDIILAYTQKPIIYAGLGHRFVGCGRFFAMVTGLGYAFSVVSKHRRWLRRTVAALYRAGISRASAVIVFNRDDQQELLRHAIVSDRHAVLLVPGSGVNMAHFAEQPVPPGDPVFLLIGRLLHDKGLNEYVAAARIVRRDYPGARFALLGPFDSNPAAISPLKLAQWRMEGIVEYLGETRDVRPHLAACTVFVLPSYREGMPRTILEAMATGRAIITTDAPGCRDTVEEGKNGFLVPVGDAAALAAAMARFCREPGLAVHMGMQSRMIAGRDFAVERINGMLIATMGLNGETPAPGTAPSAPRDNGHKLAAQPAASRPGG